MSDIARRQIRQRLESYRLAGIEYLPRVSAVPLPIAAPEVPMAATPTDSLESRREALAALARRVAACSRCPELASTRTQTVFGVGALDPDLCFVGEAPGGDEDKQGIPFVGAAGQLLDRIIAAMGLKRDECFICNILRCRPPANRTPRADEASHCREYLDATLELARPKFLCALGLTAAQNLLDSKSSLLKLRGRFHDYKGIPLICTYHPAALLPNRSPEKKKDVWDDMKALLTKMGRPIPATGKKSG
jgi:DNA polymerase